MARILVVDDQANVRKTYSMLLSANGHEVVQAKNGQEGLDVLADDEIDLVISDIKMPDKTGYDVFATARKCSQTVPVILMTGFGYDPSHSIVRASQEGLQAVLFKPFKVEQFLSELRKALQTRPQPAK